MTSNRLSVHDAAYRYPPSRNPYWNKLQDFEGMVFVENATEAHQGQWRAQFKTTESSVPTERLLHVEVGCNTGHVIREWALRDPAGAYIGIDWKFKAIFHGAEKAKKKKISNLLFFRSYAERLRYMFGPGEIDRLYLFFPDPWPKKSHWKNRFINPERLIEIAPLLKKGGIFHIKTDHPGYFDWMEAALLKVQKDAPGTWEVLERTRDLHAGHPDPKKLDFPEVTLFEKLFIKDGIPIQSLKLKRI